MRARSRSLLPELAALALLAFASPAAAQLELKPNLQPLPPSDVQMATDAATGGTLLRFTTLSWNNGAGPLELIAGEVGEEGQNVYQRVYLDHGGFYDRLTGEPFVFHPTHAHFHLENYALYTLEPIDVPVPVPGSSVKTSFCVMDTNKINGRLRGAPKRAVYDHCGAEVQGMSVGWGDRYGHTLPGQAIDVTGFPVGTYRLVIDIDPLNELLEIDEADNRSAVRIHMDPAQFLVQVLGEDDPGANVTLTSLEPATIRAGQSLPVVITGTGFDSGLGVSFENGSGPAPTLTSVVIESGTSIHAVVSVRSGGPQRTRTFDLRVGPAVLPGALTIFP